MDFSLKAVTKESVKKIKVELWLFMTLCSFD